MLLNLVWRPVSQQSVNELIVIDAVHLIKSRKLCYFLRLLIEPNEDRNV